MFLITDNDDPLAGSHNPRLITSARTTLTVSGILVSQPRRVEDLNFFSQDLLQAGVSVEPFFISADDKPFDQHKFWAVRTFFFRHYGSVLN